MVVEAPDGERACVLSFDLIGFSPRFASRLRRLAASAASTRADLVLVACTHTHSGPPTAPLRGMGRVDEAYLDSIATEAVAAVTQAANTMVACTLVSGAFPIEPFGYNRVYGDFSVIDPEMSIVAAVPVDMSSGAVRDSSSAPIVLASYACHPVTLGVNDHVSADFPGQFASALLARGVRPLFLQGCCGDIDPVVNLARWGGGTTLDAARYGRHLAERVSTLLDRCRPVGGACVRGSVDNAAVALDRSTPQSVHIERLKRAYAGVGAERLSRFIADVEVGASGGDLGDSIDLPVHLLALGDLRLLGIGAEVFAGIGLSIKRLRSKTIVAGYTGGVIGYIPTEDNYRLASSYAAHLAPFFYRSAPFVPTASRELEKKAELMIKASED